MDACLPSRNDKFDRFDHSDVENGADKDINGHPPSALAVSSPPAPARRRRCGFSWLGALSLVSLVLGVVALAISIYALRRAKDIQR